MIQVIFCLNDFLKYPDFCLIYLGKCQHFILLIFVCPPLNHVISEPRNTLNVSRLTLLFTKPLHHVIAEPPNIIEFVTFCLINYQSTALCDIMF